MNGHKNHGASQDNVHSLSNSSTGNGLLTLRPIGEAANRADNASESRSFAEPELAGAAHRKQNGAQRAAPL